MPLPDPADSPASQAYALDLSMRCVDRALAETPAVLPPQGWVRSASPDASCAREAVIGSPRVLTSPCGSPSSLLDIPTFATSPPPTDGPPLHVDHMAADFAAGTSADVDDVAVVCMPCGPVPPSVLPSRLIGLPLLPTSPCAPLDESTIQVASDRVVIVSSAHNAPHSGGHILNSPVVQVVHVSSVAAVLPVMPDSSVSLLRAPEESALAPCSRNVVHTPDARVHLSRQIDGSPVVAMASLNDIAVGSPVVPSQVLDRSCLPVKQGSAYVCPCCVRVFPRAGCLAKHLREHRGRCLPGAIQVAALDVAGILPCGKCSAFYAGCAVHERHCRVLPPPVVVAAPIPDDGPEEEVQLPFEISESDFQWVDSVGWRQLVFAPCTLKPTGKSAAAWRLCQGVVEFLLDSGRVDTGIKLHFMSASLVFAPCPVGFEESINSLLLTRMQRFLRGEFAGLWNDSRVAVARRTADVVERGGASTGVPATIVKMAAARAKQCEFRAAAQTLLAAPLLDPAAPNVHAQLVAQFSPAIPPPPAPPAPLLLDSDSRFDWSFKDVSVEVLGDDVVGSSSTTTVSAFAWVMDHLPRLRMQDHAGWRYEHYSQLSGTLVHKLVYRFNNGQLPVAARPFLAGARGCVVAKENGKARGVHSVLTLRKVAFRVDMLQSRADIAEDFAAVGQFGVGVRGGVEFVYHTNALALLAATDGLEVPDDAVGLVHSSQPAALATDFASAFPSVFRSSVFMGLEQHHEGLYDDKVRSARMLYSGAADVFFVQDNRVVSVHTSSSGVHQGCPAAGFHFGAATRPLCAAIQAAMHGENAVCSWILDDCSFAGELHGCCEGFRALKHALKSSCSAYGLLLKSHSDPELSKLKGYLPQVPPVWISDYASNAPDSIVPADILLCYSDIGMLLEQQFVLSTEGLVRVLGAPVSMDPEFCVNALTKGIDATCLLLSRIPLLLEARSEWGLLKFCGSTRQMHLPRLLEGDLLEVPLDRVAASAKVCLEHVLGCSTPLSETQWVQARLPTRHGGIGLTDPGQICHAATLSSAVATATLLQSLAPRVPFATEMLSALVARPHLIRARVSLNECYAHVGATEVNLCPPLDSLCVAADWPNQRMLSDPLHLRNKLWTLSQLTDVERDLTAAAWFRSCGLFGSGQWLHAIPLLRCFQCTPEEYQVMMRTRLLLPVRDKMPAGVTLDYCREHPPGRDLSMPSAHSLQYGYHWDTSCCLAAGPRVVRHNKARDTLVRMHREVAIGVEPEMSGLYANSQARPADFLLPPVDSKSLSRACDVVVTDPRRAECIEKGSARQALVAADLGEELKLAAHNKMLETHGFGLVQFEKVPIAFESSGAWGKGMKKLWEQLKIEWKKGPSENYIQLDMPHTWSAFTYAQFYPQLLSFQINLYTARCKLLGVAKSVRLSHLDPVMA